MERELPSYPWEMLSADLFELKNRHYFVLGDFYTKFPMVPEIKTQTSGAVIQHMREIFSQYGMPREQDIKPTLPSE